MPKSSRRLVCTLGLLSLTLVAGTPPGIPPRATPDQYSAQGAQNGNVFAASLLPPDQVKHLFAFDISKDYLVFEVACYPAAQTSLKIEPASFLLNGGKEKEPVRPSDAQSVAGQIQSKNTPRLPSTSPQVYTTAGVGHESGTDPITGRRVHGTYTNVGAGVGVGNSPDNPPSLPTPGGWPQDRELLQQQLAARALPEGSFERPVAGYLYFPRALIKNKKDVYQLHAGDIVVLDVPVKTR
jgi:hypothetical protein